MVPFFFLFRIPQGLDSGYDLEPDKEPTPQESEEKIDDIRQMLAKSSQDKVHFGLYFGYEY